MTNNAETVYYKENDSIIIIEGRVELESLMENSKAVSLKTLSQSRVVKGSVIMNHSQNDDHSVISSITWETMLSN